VVVAVPVAAAVEDDQENMVFDNKEKMEITEGVRILGFVR
jgi:hypothetical protein